MAYCRLAGGYIKAVPGESAVAAALSLRLGWHPQDAPVEACITSGAGSHVVICTQWQESCCGRTYCHTWYTCSMLLGDNSRAQTGRTGSYDVCVQPSLRSRVQACTGWYCGENKPAPQNSLLDWPAWEITGLMMSYVICMCHFSRTQKLFLLFLCFSPHRTSISWDVMLEAGILKVECAGLWGNYWWKCMKVYYRLKTRNLAFLLCWNTTFIHRVVTDICFLFKRSAVDGFALQWMLCRRVSTVALNGQSRYWLERKPFWFWAANIGEVKARGIQLVADLQPHH